MIGPANRLNDIGEYYFSRKMQEIAKLRSQGADVINLGIGSPDFFPPRAAVDKVVEEIMKPSSHGYASYRSIPELRGAMASWLKRHYQVAASSEDEILPLLGSKEGIAFITLAFVNPGDQVLVPNPGYPAYSSAVRLAGGEVIEFPLCAEKSWQPDWQELNKMDLSRVKMMWVNYPNMPTGQRPSSELFSKLVEFGRRHQILICHDNPYSLVRNGEKPMSLLQFDSDKQGVLELHSLSKVYNMAGWRVGFVVGSRSVIDCIAKVKTNIDSGMFLPIQFGAIEALQASDQWVAAQNEIYDHRNQLVEKLFLALGFSVEEKQEGLFVWAKAPDHIAQVEEFLDEILYKQHVFLTPGFIFGSQGRRYARASLCVSEDKIEKAIGRLKGFV